MSALKKSRGAKTTMDAGTVATLNVLGIVAAWILLPLVPAILIFLIFPSSTVSASGVLSKLTVRATGAFGGYLVIFAATYVLANRAVKERHDASIAYWNIRGDFVLVDENQKEVTDLEYLKNAKVEVFPNSIGVLGNIVSIKISDDVVPQYIQFSVPQFGIALIDFRGLLHCRDAVVDTMRHDILVKSVRIQRGLRTPTICPSS